MRFSQIISETSAGATGSGSVATVSSPIGATQSRNASIYGDKKVGNLLKGKKTNKPYANSVNENKQVEEAKLEEEDKIIPVGKGKKLKTGLHGKDIEPKLHGFKAPFKAHGVFVADKRGNKVCDCENDSVAQQVAKALTAFAIANEVKIQGAGVIAGGPQYENHDKDPGEYDMEGDFAKNQLHTIRRMADVLEKRIGDNENLPEWVQMKLSQAQGMMVSVTDYLISEKEKHAEKEQGIEGMVNEKAVSKAQQKFMGMVHAVQKGKMKSPSKEVADVAKGMSKKAGHDFAATKHKGLPEKVKKK